MRLHTGMWLLVLMIMIMPFEANPYLYLATNFLGIFPDFTMIKLLGLLGFGWAAIRIAAGDPATALLKTTPARLFLIFFFGVVFAGVLHGTGFVAVSRYLAFLLFLPFVVLSIRTHRDLRRVLYAMALSLILVFPYAVRQMVRYDNRLGVGLYETNYLATLIVLVIPLAFVIAFQQRRAPARTLWLLGGLVLVGMLFMTSSRGGFVGLLVAGAVFLYRWKGMLGALGALAVLILSLFILPTDLGSRALGTLFEEHRVEDYGFEVSNRAHVALFWAALRMIADNPIFGVGPFNFKALSTSYTGLPMGNIAHNSFLEIGAEFGLPVLAVFCLLLFSVFRILGRATRLRGSPEAVELAGWAEGLRSGLTGFLVAGFFISAEYEKLLWLTVFVTIVVGRFAREYAAAPEASEEAVRPALGAVVAPEPLR